MTAPAEPKPASLVALLRRHAAAMPDRRAYVFLADRGGEEAAISFGELDRRARALAVRIAAQAPRGERALLLFPSGIEFVVALFGCLYAGIIAVPLMLPRRHGARDASAAILTDCTPRLALSTAALIAGARGDLTGRFPADRLAWLATDGDEPVDRVARGLPADPAAEDIAILQYTSGSTSAPKGVVVSHANLLANLAMIQAAFGTTRTSTLATWLPHYHDMGLILHLLHSFYAGAPQVLMSPVAFLQRPLNWLRAIGEYRADFSGAPNFAYDLCVSRYRPEQMEGVDLSAWRVAVNGAEPVRAGTIDRFAETFARHGFARRAVTPAYGMAEAGVLIAARTRADGPVYRRLSRDELQRNQVAPPQGDADARLAVGCGAQLIGERIAIVERETRRRLGPDEIGEIWVAGPNIAGGYWSNPQAGADAFAATIAGEEEPAWLRTGDLGFVDGAGELFVTGRIKDVIIIRGTNHYPQDIEHTVETAHPALAQHGAAAFATVDPDGDERLVVVQEIERSYRHRLDSDELTRRVREAVVAEHDIAPFAVTLLRPGALPKTTSGKVQRALSRQLWLDGGLDLL